MAEAVCAESPIAVSADSADCVVAQTAIGPIGSIGAGSSSLQSGPLYTPQHLLALPARSIVPVPPCPATVVERAAVIEAGDGCDRTKADRRALAEFGLASWGELADAHGTVVRTALRGLPASTSHEHRRLMQVTVEFLGKNEWRQAVEHGWPLLELFGVHAFAPSVRIEAWGAITAFALSRLSPVAIERITAGEIVIGCRTDGVKLVHRLGRPSLRCSVLWWECTRWVGTEPR